MTDVRNKQFHSMYGIITGLDAQLRYPNPKFFERVDKRMRLDELRSILHRNCDEAARVVEMLRDTSRFNTKEPIINTANILHDFRVSVNLHGGEAGRPYLWEV